MSLNLQIFNLCLFYCEEWFSIFMPFFVAGETSFSLLVLTHTQQTAVPPHFLHNSHCVARERERERERVSLHCPSSLYLLVDR